MWSGIRIREQASFIETAAEIFRKAGVPEPNISRAGLTWVWSDPQRGDSLRVTFDSFQVARIHARMGGKAYDESVNDQEGLLRIAQFVHLNFTVVGQPTISQGPPPSGTKASKGATRDS